MAKRKLKIHFRIRCLASLFIALVVAPVFGQSPREAPGEQKFQVTVRSEIARGCDEVFQAALNSGSDHKALWTSMHDVIKRNISMHKDSDGFMLGARLQQLKELDHALESLRSLSNPTHEEKEEISSF